MTAPIDAIASKQRHAELISASRHNDGILKQVQDLLIEPGCRNEFGMTVPIGDNFECTHRIVSDCC